jgi:putative membrane protein
MGMKKLSQWTLLGMIAALFPLAGNALAQWRGRGYDWGHGPGMMDGYGMGWLGSIIMVAFWIAVIVGIVFLIRWLVMSTKGGIGGFEDSALEILKKRYARGEIDKKEFEQKKKDLI